MSFSRKWQESLKEKSYDSTLFSSSRPHAPAQEHAARMGQKRCAHGNLKHDCTKCNPCPHGKLKRKCADCNPCPHGKVKHDCVDCKGCPHGKRKRACAACNH